MLQQFRRKGLKKKRLKIREDLKAKSKARSKQILEPILVKTARNTFHECKMSNLVLRQFMTLGWKVIIWKGSKIKITEETEEVIKVKIGDEGTDEDDKEAHKDGLESKEDGFGIDKKEFFEKKHEKERLC